jgi:hypothetical protein
MALCPVGQKTTIKWQYSGEEKQEIIGADNYTTQVVTPNFTGGQSSNVKYLIQQFVNVYNAQGVLIYADYPSTLVDRYGKINRSYIEARLDNRGNLLWWGIIEGHNQVGNIDIWENPVPIPGNRVTLNRTQITRADNQPDTGGNLPSSCTFKVLKNNEVVYQKTAPTCPPVNHFCGEECPPGTCQCDCGTEVCCYDTTTGKAIKSFKR